VDRTCERRRSQHIQPRGNCNSPRARAPHPAAWQLPRARRTPASSSTGAAARMITNNARQPYRDKAQTVWTVKSGVVYEQPAGYGEPAAPATAPVFVCFDYYTACSTRKIATACGWSWSGSTWVLEQQSGPFRDPCVSGLHQRTAGAPVRRPAPASSGFGIKVVATTFYRPQWQPLLAASGRECDRTGNQRTRAWWDAYYGTNLSTWQSIRQHLQMNIIRLAAERMGVAKRTPPRPAGQPYQTIVATAVANITAAHMYVILDLHWATAQQLRQWRGRWAAGLSGCR